MNRRGHCGQGQHARNQRRSAKERTCEGRAKGGEGRRWARGSQWRLHRSGRGRWERGDAGVAVRGRRSLESAYFSRIHQLGGRVARDFFIFIKFLMPNADARKALALSSIHNLKLRLPLPCLMFKISSFPCEPAETNDSCRPHHGRRPIPCGPGARPGGQREF